MIGPRLASRALRGLAFAPALFACGPREATPPGQILLYVETDAPLPPPPGTASDPNDPIPLFDRLRIDVIPPGATASCAGCTHEFDVDRDLVGEGRASVGITTPPGATGYVARVRLFRGAFVELGEPRTDASLDTFIALPPIGTEGITSITATLRTDDVAHPVGSLASPVAAAVGGPSGRLVGTWPGAARKPCVGDPPEGMACVPGGAFWMGDPLLRGALEPGDSVVLRVAVVSPFFLDQTEMTVASMRATGLASKIDPTGSSDPMVNRPDDGAPGYPLHCTYTTAPGNDEALPTNCISWNMAHAACQSRGADLPTEAEYQYVAGALLGRRFVWGTDAPRCGDAIYARAQGYIGPEESCPGLWVAPSGSGARDRLEVQGGEIVDLAGNVAELARDRWNLSSESCWPVGIAYDPECTTASATSTFTQHTVVGGGWLSRGRGLAAAARRPTVDFSAAMHSGPAGGPVYAPFITNVGFRCMMQATP